MFLKGLAFLAGTLAVCQLPGLTPLTSLVPLLCLAFVFLLWRRAAVSAFLVAGVLWTWQFGSAAVAHGIDPGLNGRQWLVRGDISSVPQTDADHASFDLDVVDAPPELAQLRRLRLAWYERDVQVRPGERWQMLVRLRHPHGLRNPGDSDFEGRLFDQSIDAVGYVVRCACNLRTNAATWRAAVLRAREWVANRIAESVPASSNIGILRDLAVGLEGRVTPQQWQIFAATGTTHLMAISGFHVAGVALAAIACVRFAWRRIAATASARADLESLVGLAAAIGYALLAGLSVPTQRTLVTLACVFGARFLRRATSIWNLIGAALVGVLLLDPLAVLGAGFWLSFGTVAGILYALAGRLARASELRDLVPAQLAATLCLLPLTLALFGSVSVIGPAINLIAIPVFSLLLVPAILVGVVVLMLPGPCGAWWFSAIDYAIGWVWPAFAAAGEAAITQIHLAARPPWTLLLLAVGVLWCLAPWPLRLRCLALGFAAPALLWRAPLLANGAFDVTVLDVGQGLAVFVETRAHALLFDTGPQSQSGRAAAEFSVIPFLESRGTRRLDALILSHGDRDHVGGVAAVRARMQVDSEWRGGIRPSGQARRCSAGKAWLWDDVRFEFLSPVAQAQTRIKENDASCVLRISGRRGVALLTGDIEAAAERELLQRESIGRVDLVVVPHHGSHSSSGISFVASLAPRWAVAAAGYDNRWRFPKPEIVERWQAAGARVLTTYASGAVAFRFEPEQVLAEPTEWREVQRRFWHAD